MGDTRSIQAVPRIIFFKRLRGIWETSPRMNFKKLLSTVIVPKTRNLSSVKSLFINLHFHVLVGPHQFWQPGQLRSQKEKCSISITQKTGRVKHGIIENFIKNSFNATYANVINRFTHEDECF